MALNLDDVAAHLEALEEAIIYKLIDRAQFKLNKSAYAVGESCFPKHKDKSLLDVRIMYEDQAEAKFGRFEVPEERPFSQDLPASERDFPYSFTELAIDTYDRVNLTADILKSYVEFLPKICEAGDDGQYGSSVEHDVHALRAISSRIHYGAFYVAECKFQSEPKKYRELISAGNEESLMETLTRPDVEERILNRVRDKIISLQESVNPGVRHIIAPETVVEYYEKVLMPLTKKGQIKYLMNRGKYE